ncbi:hypothetical protein ACOI1C_17835 [Bacillus sp. DJP31]
MTKDSKKSMGWLKGVLSNQGQVDDSSSVEEIEAPEVIEEEIVKS